MKEQLELQAMIYLDRDTISQIIKEAIEEPAIPPEMVRDLEPVVQNWIISKRPHIRESVLGKGQAPGRTEVGGQEERAGTEVTPLKVKVLYEGSKPAYSGWFSGPDGRKAFYVCVAALAHGQMARSCWAKLTILSPGDTLAHKVGEFELHPRGDEEPYLTPTVNAKLVDIVPGIPQYFDVAFSAVGPPVQQGLTSGCVVSVGVGFPPEPQAQPEGCWIATPIALYRPTTSHQAYLPPGSYHVMVTVGDQNGPADSPDFTLISPRRGQELQLSGSGQPASPARRIWRGQTKG